MSKPPSTSISAAQLSNQQILGKRKRSDLDVLDGSSPEDCLDFDGATRPRKKARLDRIIPPTSEEKPYPLVLPVIKNGNGGKRTPKRRSFGRPNRRRLRRGSTVIERFGKLSWSQTFSCGEIQIRTLAYRKWEPSLDVSVEDEVLEDASCVLVPLFEERV